MCSVLSTLCGVNLIINLEPISFGSLSLRRRQCLLDTMWRQRGRYMSLCLNGLGIEKPEPYWKDANSVIKFNKLVLNNVADTDVISLTERKAWNDFGGVPERHWIRHWLEGSSVSQWSPLVCETGKANYTQFQVHNGWSVGKFLLKTNYNFSPSNNALVSLSVCSGQLAVRNFGSESNTHTDVCCWKAVRRSNAQVTIKKNLPVEWTVYREVALLSHHRFASRICRFQHQQYSQMLLARMTTDDPKWKTKLSGISLC